MHGVNGLSAAAERMATTSAWVQCALVLGPACAVLALITAVGVMNGVPLALVVEDPAVLARLHPLTGIQSSLGILLWCAAATLCVFTAAVARRTVSPSFHLFLLVSALLSFYLLIDDLFQFHENLAWRYLGVRQKYVLLGLGLAVGAYLVGFRRVILGTPYALLVVALLLLSASAVIDAVVLKLWPQRGDWGLFFEEGCKWLGIACWCGYFTLVCARTVAASTRSAR